jgi:hypothetical protein
VWLGAFTGTARPHFEDGFGVPSSGGSASMAPEGLLAKGPLGAPGKGLDAI